MNKKTKRISLFILSLLLSLISVTSFAESPAVPNYLITENPHKEVKTVEANKNRKHTEMNISVNKLNLKEIEGIELESGEIVIYLPKKSEISESQSNEIYYIADSIDSFSEATNKKNRRSVGKNNIDNKIEFESYQDYIIIKKNNSKELFLGKLDLGKNDIKEVWQIKKINHQVDIAGCRVTITDWEVIKKYLKHFNTSQLTFYYTGDSGNIRVSGGNNPSVTRAVTLLPSEYAHSHTGDTSGFDPRVGCFTYTTGSYIAKKHGNSLFNISTGGRKIRDIEAPDTSGTLGYIVNSEFSTVYSTNGLTSIFSIAKDRYGYKDSAAINEHGLIYQLNFGTLNWESAIKKIEETFGGNTFEQKFDYTVQRELTTRKHNINFKILPQKYQTLTREIDLSDNKIDDTLVMDYVFSDLPDEGYYMTMIEGEKLPILDFQAFNNLNFLPSLIPNSGTQIKYNSTNKKFEFVKKESVDYKNSDLKIQIRKSGTHELKYLINLTLKNKASEFEIIQGEGTLDFGILRPGELKKAQNIIAFKNLKGAKIDVKLDDTRSKNKMFKIGMERTQNTTVDIENILLTDLKAEGNNTNTFKISGEINVPANVEEGEYLGELKVTITIIP